MGKVVSQEAHQDKQKDCEDEPEYSQFSVEVGKYFLDKMESTRQKAFELMAMISAGSIAVIVGFSSEEPSIFLKIALVLMVLTILLILASFFATSDLHRDSGLNFMSQKDTDTSGKTDKGIGWKSKCAVVSFCLSNLAMLLSVLV